MLKKILSLKTIFFASALALVLSVFYFEIKKPLENQEQTVVFWDYWTGEEKEPVRKLVDKFNQEDHGFKVKMLTISLPRKKIQMAITGNVAPDLVHLDGDMVSDFANRNALLALDKFAEANQMSRNDFITVYWDMLNIHKQQWAIPLMPTCEAMHINKSIYQKSGLANAPRNLNDLKTVFDNATDFKDYKHIGWLPTWPPWIGKFIPVIFGGKWGEVQSDGSIKITANSPANIQAWSWVQENFAKKIPKNKLQAFTEGFKAYQSIDNPFYAGKIAVENNGVWEKHLAAKFAPNIDVEIAPFPSDSHKMATLVTVDSLAIPKGAKNPELAFEFIAWLLKKENVEYLAIKQQKFTPLKNNNPGFIKNHPNPYIQTFIDLAKSPNASYFPQIPIVLKYRREIKEAYGKVMRLEASAEDALNQLQETMEAALSKTY